MRTAQGAWRPGRTPQATSTGTGVVRGRLGVPELLRNLATVGFPACPRIGLVKTRNGGILACVEPGKRSIDCIFRRHDDRRCLLRRVARDVLKPRRCRTRQHRLNAHTLITQILLQRMAETDDVRLRGAIDPIQIGDARVALCVM